LPELRELEIHNSTLTESGLEQVVQLDRLERLSLLGTRVSPEGLTNICRMNRLKSLVMHLPERANSEQLCRLTQLERLRLAAGNTLGGDDLEFLADMPRLRVFWLQCSVEGNVLAALRQVPQLTELRLQANQLTDHDLEHIKNHILLQHLTLESNSGNFVSDDGLSCLARLTELRFLNVSNCRGITDRGLQKIDHLRKLRTLRLNSTSVTDQGLPHLAGLTQLENLSLRSTSITPPGLKQLGALLRIRKLTLPAAVDAETRTDLQQQFSQAVID